LKNERDGVLTDFKMGRLDVGMFMSTSLLLPWQPWEIVLTTFDLARRDIAQLDDLAWSAVFVDEAHRVKNPKSKITLAYNQFACLCRFGLTGKTTLLLEGGLMQRDN
jgi:SNF2 family DNA or RNA helicase